MSVKAGIIESVHRLTVFNHYIVCDIDDVVYRSDACRAETHTQPQRRRRNFNVFNDSCAVSGAFLAVDRNVYIVSDVAVASLDGGCRDIQRAPKRCGRLPCQTYDGKAIRAVRRDLKFNSRVAQSENVVNVVACLAGIIVENENSVRRGAGHIVSIKSQLFD